MKKQKALEELTHQDIVEGLINDENIQDNLLVSNDYSLDRHGNSLITLGFENFSTKKRKLAGFVLFSFNIKGRLIGLEVAVKKGKSWEIASSEKFIDFTGSHGSDKINVKKGNN
jgi:hypothetical protein